ncbi:Hcp family type VI secretion system effector [Halomonas huangheensis]|uniref:Hcp1 family type VI secretion system effector n=1 Tax=Halomonas huangheensis TaxID=1178482 RepID=W1N968_9GAMM|nr:type VI secretion system tube protein Hcp [Halomonas huangheensis]ALM53982.1 fimbrial protein [Halomonas huangheensis]ERL52058.1 Hcp1 family type VI secretion system effector [Halomonas huangheensis]
MAFDAYLKIDGIPGESLDANHTDWIELLSFEFGASQATSATASSAGGASAERVNLSEFAISKFIDKASPKLFEACCRGQHIKEVVLQVHRAGGDQVRYLEVRLEEVIVSSTGMEGMASFAQNGGGGSTDSVHDTRHDLPSEEIKFNYARIKVNYTQQKRQDGQGGGNIAGGWDRTRNRVYS